jgi:hypothetical protein
MLTEQQRRERIRILSGFFWTLAPAQRSRLTMDVLLSTDGAIPDRELIRQADCLSGADC